MCYDENIGGAYMYKKKYLLLASLNFVLGICAICLYLPYTINALNIKGFGWLDFAKDILKNNYFNILVYFGMFLLVWFILLNIISLASRPNKPKTLFKISTIVALILPLIYVLALKNNAVLEFWINHVAENIKMICYVVLSVSWGLFALALIFNFTKRRKATFYHILQALAMCTLLTLFVAWNGWCGWSVDYIKMFGFLMGILAIYLPISTIILSICAKNN